jgi:DNA damage-inducible protein 1
MTLLVQNLLKEDAYYNLDVEIDVTVEDLKCLCEIEAQIPVSEQAIFFKNKELSENSKRLSEYGVGNNDMIMLTVAQKTI